MVKSVNTLPYNYMLCDERALETHALPVSGVERL